MLSRREKFYGLTALALALATFHGLGWLVFFYPPLLSQMLHGLSPKRRLALATLWGVLFSAAFYHWVGAYGLPAWLALSLARGLPWALYPLPLVLLEWLLGRARSPRDDSDTIGLRPQVLDWSALLAGALGLSLVSAALLWGITGIDWETPAGGLVEFPQLLAPLPWIGLVGIALLIGLVGHLLCSGRGWPSFLGAAILGIWLSGSHAWRKAETVEATRPLTIALIQSGFSQDEKWDEEHRVVSADRLLDMTSQAAHAGAQLVVWPETAWPYRGLRRRVTNTRRIGKAARNLKVDILASSIEEVQTDHDPRRWLNSVSFVESSGKFSDHYEKQRLAPFAEYLPLPDSWQPFLRRFRPFSSVSRYSPGPSPVVFSTAHGHRFAVLICYESMTPRLTSQLASQVDFFVVVTNDAPFDHSAANEAHFRSAILRAIETGKPVYQAANTGVTGAVDGWGQVLSRTEPGFSGPSVQYSVFP